MGDRNGVESAYRLDHVLVCGDLEPRSARYRSDLRERIGGQGRLSDHAAIEAEVVLSL